MDWYGTKNAFMPCCDAKETFVVKSGRKRQQETDSCINPREDTVVSFRAYWVERFLPLSLVSCSFSLAFSIVLLPSVFLSLLPVLAFLPSFLLWVVTRSSGKCTQNKSARSAVTVRICMFVRSRKNLHTCKLPLAGSRSPLVKYARGSHIGFRSTSQTRSCALRMPGTLPSQLLTLLWPCCGNKLTIANISYTSRFIYY